MSQLPVEKIPGDEDRTPQPGIALCLSGGGYRAMLFHLGALLRLNELGYLSRLDRVSSVSGGSIIAGVLGQSWKQLDFKDGRARAFDQHVVKPVRALASRTIDAGAIIGGALLPGTIGDHVIGAYRKHLFDERTLQDLPEHPRFVFNATNVKTGALWRFEKPYMADYRIGRIPNPDKQLALAVAASAAFPPFLSPVVFDLHPEEFAADGRGDLCKPPYTTEAVLTDGGVYDNLGLETAFKKYQTVLVSDGGGALSPQPDPKHDWLRHTRRVLDIIDNQVGALRKRQLIDSFKSKARQGTYWGIRTNIADYKLADALPFDHDQSRELARTPTRLKALDPELQTRIIQWGYAVCDAAMRKHVCAGEAAPTGLWTP